MATYSRKQVVTCLSIVYLILVTALAGYASSRADRFSIPIPNILSGFTTALPLVAGLLLEGGYDFTRIREKRQHEPKGSTQRPPLVIIANSIIFIYSTVVITLLGTHAAPPAGLDCGLQSRWQHLFQTKNTEAIRAIQEALKCCGLVKTHDRAWPFPDRSHDIHACEKAFGYTRGCLGPWRNEEKHAAGLLMGVVALVFIWQFAIIAIPTKRESWLHTVVPDRVSRMIADERRDDNRPRRAIDYLPRYRDNAVEEASDDEESTSQRIIGGGVQQVRNALTGAGNTDDSSQPVVENEWTRT